MGKKPGTLVGRFITELLPDDSKIKKYAEAADKSFDSGVEQKNGETIPLKETKEVQGLVDKLKDFVLGGVKAGILVVNFPYVDGDEEAKAKEAAYKLVEAYVNETPGDDD